MQKRYSPVSERITSAFASAWAHIKKAAKAVVLFFAACASRITGLFRHKPEHEEWAEPVSDDTQVFDSIDASYRSGSAPKKVEHEKKQREMPRISREHLSGEGKEHINMFTARRHEPNFIVGIILTSFKLVLIGIFMIGAAGLGTLIGVAKAYMDTTPKLNTAEIENQSETSYIYDRNKQLITTYTGTENRDWAPINEIPQMLQDAVVSIEDVRFYYHSGVDIKRLVGAFINNLMNSSVQGGSTITQQLIKNNLLSPERTYKRKIQEAYLAMQLETKYSKPQILEAYLNTIPLGESNYGVKAAAMDYFGKDLSSLTLRECAMLAGITQYPYLYDPRRCYYNVKDPSIINERTDHVLLQMYKAGYITQDEYDAARADNVQVKEKSTVNQMYDMPYFVEYAVYDVITHLLEQRHMQDTDENRASLDKELRTNGYRIYTTVDPDIQKTVEDTLANWQDYPKLKDEKDAVMRYKNSDGSITETIQPQAAAVVMDQHTGQLLAVVGGRDVPKARKTLNRVYQTTMPVGSSIKPLAVYAPAIDKGASDGTVVPNLDLPIEGWDSETGFPAGGSSYYGPVTLRTGLVQSLNSATAYTLLNIVGLEDAANYLIQMGVNPSHISKTGSGLALGTSSITPIEMAGAYATIANSGVYLEPLSFTTVEDKDGNIILDADTIRDKSQRQVFKESTAWLVTDMLTNAVASGTGKEAQIPGMTVGGKTGTNQNVKGIFFAGITPYYTSTLWIGSDGYKALSSKVYASDYAAPLWQSYMSKIFETKALPDKPIIDKTPESLGLVKYRICSVSGMLATEACDHDPGGHTPVDAWFVPGTEPTEECNVHQIYRVCSVSGKLATAYCPDSTVSEKCLVFLPPDSVYWKLSSEKLNKYLPGTIMAPEGGFSPGAPGDYYCNAHTEEWFNEQQSLSTAISAANAQINTSSGVLADPTLTMTMDDRDQLSSKIDGLRNIIAMSNVTSGVIEQRTWELKNLTDTLLSIYRPATGGP
jgi:penicillin-binding protein 1A